MILFQSLLAAATICVVFSEKECEFDKDVYKSHMGNKTPYRFVANFNDSKIEIPGCQASKIWMLIRHGTRYPGNKKIKKFDEILPTLKNMLITNAAKGSICKDELWSFRKWKLYAREGDDKDLAHEGKFEMFDIAQRMQKRFPDLFPAEFDNITYSFKYTLSQRCEESARYFALGLFGRNDSKTVWYPDPVHKDPVLRFYKACEKWHANVKRNKETYYDCDQFVKTKLFRKVQENVTSKFGLETLISEETLKLLYLICGFDTAWNSEVSLWCQVFSPEDIQVLEYLDDMQHYWVDGYGYNLTKQQACPLLRNFNTFLESDTTTSLNFAHSGTILKLLSHLGLYQDSEPLRYDNFNKTDRLWKMSQIDGFASNIALVLFECTEGDKIMVLHQEKEVFIPGCPENGLCLLETFKKIFNDSIYECNFEEMCALDEE